MLYCTSGRKVKLNVKQCRDIGKGQNRQVSFVAAHAYGAISFDQLGRM
jgi:hypothetical protein